MALAALVVLRARYTADLSAFLPIAPSRAQQFLVGQLDGLASSLILLDIEGADAAVRASLSNELAGRLRKSAFFRSVLNGQTGDVGRDRDWVINHRYLLSDRTTPEYFSVPGLHAAMSESVALLSSSMGLLAQDLFARDPTGETLHLIDQFGQFDHQPRFLQGVWVTGDGRGALLIAETRAKGSDTDGQEQAIEFIRRSFSAAQSAVDGPPLKPAVLRLTGPGVFAVQARRLIQHEAIRLSLISSLIITSLLLLVYRSLSMLMLGLLPVVSGALAGVAAVALGFGVVHGLTLGFGVTLIGEAVDYSVYLFIQAKETGSGHGRGDASDWGATLWPTIRLGMLTSICGFATLLPSVFPGLAQLGLYSIVGLLAAGLATRYVLPSLLPRNLTVGLALPIGRFLTRAAALLRSCRHVLWLLPCAAGITLFWHRNQLWSRELSVLSPVPVAEQTLDAVLRADLGAPDVRTLVVLTGRSSEAVLAASEVVGKVLDGMIANGVIEGYQSPARLLPSLATQRLRRTSLPGRAEMAARLSGAAAGLHIRVDRLQPFLDDVESARTGHLIDRPDLEGTSLASAVDSLLIRRGDEWTGLMPLQATRSGPYALSVDTNLVRHAISAIPMIDAEATVLDIKGEVDSLYSGYLRDAQRLSLLGLGAILVLLLVSLRSPRRVFRVVAPLILAVLAVITGLTVLGRSMTMLHLIGLLLVIAIGSNYALFFDRNSSPADANEGSRIMASLMIANLTTVIGFGTLALSSVPVLADLGMTVAPGTLLALLFSATLSAPARTGRV